MSGTKYLSHSGFSIALQVIWEALSTHTSATVTEQQVRSYDVILI
jgi:hypothetical protein